MHRIPLNRSRFAALALLGLLLAAPSTAQNSRPDPDLERVIEIARSSDSFAIAEFVQSQGDDRQIADRYDRLVRSLYDKRQLPAMIATARAGILYCLTHSAENATRDTKLAADLKGAAKTIAYNLGANTWPGWNEAGITLTPTDVATGLDAARLNLRLGLELKRPSGPIAAAHWLLGAQLLAAGRHADAVREFQASAAIARASKDTANELLATGYTALAKMLGKLGPDGAQEFASARERLESEKIQDGKFFSDQLETARKVFARQ